MYENISAGVVGKRLPNGKVKVVKNVSGQVGEIFESDAEFNKKYGRVNEGSNQGTGTVLLESING